MAELNPRALRSVYLLTYSQADLDLFPDKESFAEAILDSCAVTSIGIKQWVCCREPHVDGGQHYHMAIKFARCLRWLPIRKSVQDSLGIAVHFSARHINYYSAWLYCTKQDPNPLQSAEHPELANAPRTMAASQAISQRHDNDEEQAPGAGIKRRNRLTNFEVSEIIRTNGIKTKLQLYAFAEQQRADGKIDLVQFVTNRGSKVVDDVIRTTLDMMSAPSELERSLLQRITILERCAQETCVEGCDGLWMRQAKDVLDRNSIEHGTFTKALYELLRDGRGKYRNLLLIGPANCGKSFLLSPLTSIYRSFSNPASTSFAWVGVEDAEIILLNDFRWSSQVNAHTTNACPFALYKVFNSVI